MNMQIARNIYLPLHIPFYGFDYEVGCLMNLGEIEIWNTYFVDKILRATVGTISATKYIFKIPICT